MEISRKKAESLNTALPRHPIKVKIITTQNSTSLKTKRTNDDKTDCNRSFALERPRVKLVHKVKNRNE